MATHTCMSRLCLYLYNVAHSIFFGNGVNTCITDYAVLFRYQCFYFNWAINITFNCAHFNWKWFNLITIFNRFEIKFAEKMAIQWAPWNVPLHRRLEVLTIAFFIFFALGLQPLACLVILYLLVGKNILNKISNSTINLCFH